MEIFVTINPDESPFPKTLNEIKTLLIDDFPYNDLKFVLCREVAKHEHYHLYIQSSQEYSDKSRNCIRRYLREIFKGEIRISKRQVENPIRAIAYTIKDGNYITHNIDWWDFVQAKQISKPKAKGYSALISDFYSTVGDKSETKLVNEVIDIFDICNIPIDTFRIAKIVRLSRIKQRDSDYRKRLVDKIIDDI